ncbi:MAG: PAS domain-containing protein, partial [Culicoidibacterales bacterium]
MTQLIVTSLSTPELINFIDTSLEITTVHPRQLLPPELHAAQVIFIIETTFEQQLSTYQSLVLRPNQIVFIVLMPDQLKDFATIHRTFAVELCATIDYLIAPLTPEKRDIRVCVWEQAQQSKRPILKIQDLLLNFFHSLPEIAWFKDQHLNYLSVNQAFLNLYGKTSAEIIGKSDEQIWAEPLPINAGDSDQEILKTHEA